MKRDQLMGVINITPNSFSDGNLYLSSTSFQKRLNELSKSTRIIDIGAESTAPQNQKVSLSEELKRLEEALLPSLDLIQKLSQEQQVEFSFDTYKREVIEWAHSFLIKSGVLKGFIWNDISGQFDDAIPILKKYPSISYILSHSLVPERNRSGEHKLFAANNPSTISKRVSEFFCLNENKIKQEKLENRIFFDPAFGFSKSTEESWELWRALPEIISQLGTKIPWVIGISRKSFLKEKLASLKRNIDTKELDFYQFQLLDELSQKIPSHQLIFRVHRTSFEYSNNLCL